MWLSIGVFGLAGSAFSVFVATPIAFVADLAGSMILAGVFAAGLVPRFFQLAPSAPPRFSSGTRRSHEMAVQRAEREPDEFRNRHISTEAIGERACQDLRDARAQVEERRVNETNASTGRRRRKSSCSPISVGNLSQRRRVRCSMHCADCKLRN